MTEKERALKELRLLQLEKEKRRLETAERSGEIQEVQAGRAKEFAEDLGPSVVHGASLGFSDEIEGAIKSALGDKTYEEYRDIDRAETEARRERSPVASTMGEMVGGGVTSTVLPIGGYLGAAAEGAAVGLGESEAELGTSEMAGDIALGAGAGAAVKGALDVLGIPFTDPKAIRARTLGAGKKEMKSQFGTFNNIYKAIDNLKERGFLKKGSRYSSTTGKYGKAGKYDKRTKDPLGDYEMKSTKALKDVGTEIGGVLKKGKVKYTFEDLENFSKDGTSPELYKILDEFEGNSRDKKQAQKLIDDVLEDIRVAMDKPNITVEGEEFGAPIGINLKELNTFKQVLQRDSLPLYKKVAQGSGDELEGKKVELIGRVGRLLKDYVENRSTSELGVQATDKLKKLNSHYGDLSLINDMVQDRIATRQASGFSGSAHTGASLPYILGKGVETAGGGVGGGLMRARIGDVIEGPMSKPLEVLGGGMRQAPARMMSTDQNGRTPQSVDEVFTSMRFPRTTQGILENKEAFLQKVKLSDAENFDAVKTILESSEAEIRKVLPTLTKTMPYLFEYDEYGRFDGVVPQDMRPATIVKIWDMPYTNTEKTALIDIMNRTGELDL
jgi:hypothetical protein